MPLHFIQTQKGKPGLLLNGFIYKKYRFRDSRQYWRCDQYLRSCTSRCVTEVDEVISRSGHHNHPADPAEIEKRIRLNELKQASVDTTSIPSQLVADATVNMPKSVAGIFPTALQLTHTVHRTRKVVSSAPSNPASLTDLILPLSYTKTLTDEDFLLFDSGSSEDRILLFSTLSNLRALSQCDNWYADGTFKSSPPLFKQIFTIHGVKSQTTLPLVYGLLPDKKEATYTRFLTAMNNLGPTAQVIFKPQSILLDFEFGSLNAFRTVFATSELRGCFFHHSQCIWKHIQGIPDILAKYNSDPDFALNVRHLPALAFVPVPAVRSSFDVLLNTPFFEQNERLLRPLIDYYEETWIGCRRRGRWRPPLFPHELWNCYQSTVVRNSRTNNAVEGWNRRFNVRIGMTHPTIWKFIEKIREEQSVVEMKLNQILAGTPNPSRRKKYRDLESRLLAIVEDYENRSVVEYLEGIAQNIGFYD